MARKVITSYVSDISGQPIEDESAAVEIRIRWPVGNRNAVVLDALESEVEELIRVGREDARRGRPPKNK